jgi:hypothetical protein
MPGRALLHRVQLCLRFTIIMSCARLLESKIFSFYLFIIIYLFSRGSFSQVHRAVHRMSGQNYAVKIIDIRKYQQYTLHSTAGILFILVFIFII